ncbi:hypothetical protein H5410_020674 [Solanum commersonii]|uniref:DUF1985 domain-containing protein n=1 Tax=Solanum commersonii TaxID=4109 RepID=A0A9J5Z949_SOLCO|nr:hypothetical protein H5410_020674 [Solanum commersonii]
MTLLKSGNIIIAALEGDIIIRGILLYNSIKYAIKKVPTHAIRFGVSFNTNFLEFQKSIGDDGQISKCLLLLELEQGNSKVLHIRHANGVILKFGIKEFAIITGLKCKGNTKEFEYPESTPCRLFQKYFPGAVKSVSKNHLVQRFLMGNWENNQDALQMAILYFLHTFILAQTSDSSISVNEFLMVEDGRYQVYPWRQIAFTKLMDLLRQDFNLSKQLYRLFFQNACSNIVPTPEELAAFDLTEDEHDPPSSPTTTSVNPKIVQPNDIVDFDDFSTRPPEQLLRRSFRVSDTSSPPPPKRRKKVDTPKTKVSEPSQPYQSNVSLNQPFSIPDGPSTPAANVDKKFEELVILIKENHSQLMLSRRKENNKVDPQSSNKQPSSHIW